MNIFIMKMMDISIGKVNQMTKKELEEIWGWSYGEYYGSR